MDRQKDRRRNRTVDKLPIDPLLRFRLHIFCSRLFLNQDSVPPKRPEENASKLFLRPFVYPVLSRERQTGERL